jgi:ribose transport system ATP-binding protein
MEALIELIVGRSVGRAMERSGRSVDRTGTPLLSVRGLSTATGVREVDLDLHAGEILGIAGLMGSGRSELARAIFGIDALTAGEIRLRGEPVRIRRAADAIEHGIVLVPEDRRAQGLVLAHGVGRNLTLALLRRLSRGGMLDDGEGERIAERYVERLGIRTRSLGTPVRRLSGGNQQKVVLAKWLATEPEVLILDEPTVGVDIGTRSEIVDLVRDLADNGKAVLVISSELAELLALADRILVLRDGRIDRSIDRDEVGGEPELHRLVQEAA